MASALSRISGTTLISAAILVVTANLFALARSGSVLAALGFRPEWRDLFLAYSASNISNLPLNVVGQSLTRAVVLVRKGIPFGVTVMATYIERLLAAGLLFLFSLIGVWFLFGAISFEMEGGGGELLSTIAGIAIAGGVVGFKVFRGEIREFFSVLARWQLRLWKSAVLTVLCHGAGLAAYVVILSELDPQCLSFGLVAALAIIMFLTSLPISFAGWGLRELSAASTLGFVGISADVAIASAVAIGVLFLAATGLFAAFGIPLLVAKIRPPPAPANEKAAPAIQSAVPVHQDWDGKIVQACAVLCAILIFFRIPTKLVGGDLLINVNVADVIVFVGMSVIVLMIAAGRLRSLFPRYMSATLAGISAVIIAGLLVSYIYGHLGNWAVYVRGVGWILMLGYAALAAAMVCIAGDRGRLLVLRSLIICGLTVCALQLAGLAWSVLVSPIPTYALAYPLHGFANNQNAFSFELAMVGVLLIVARTLGHFDQRQWVFTASVILLAVTIYFTASRTGAVFVVVLAALDSFVARRWVDGTRPAFGVTALAAIAIIVAILTPYIVYGATVVLADVFRIDVDARGLFLSLAQPGETGSTRLLHPSPDLERWQTILGGLRHWADNPVFGAGMGAYVESIRAAGQKVHGVHSIYIWFLSEMGLVGFGAVFALASLVAVKSWRMMTSPASRPWGFAILGILSFMLIGGLVQDFFYQRIFWFSLGLAAAYDVTGVEKASDARVFMAVVAVLSLVVFLLAL